MTWYGSGGSGGSAVTGAPAAGEIQSGWVVDAADVSHYFERFYNEQTGTYGAATYTSGPGGAATSPTLPIGPAISGTPTATTAREVQSGWVLDTNDQLIFWQRIFNEDTSAFDPVTYAASPGGAAVTPAGAIRPYAGPADANVELQYGWVRDSANDNVIWFERAYDEVTAAYGPATYFVQPGGAVTALVGTATLTDESLPAFARELQYGWAQDQNGAEVFWQRGYDESTGGFTTLQYFASPDQPTPIVPALPLVPRQGAQAGRDTYVELVRLDGNSLNATAVPEVPVHPNNATQQDMIEGLSYTVTGPRRGLSWRFLRETAQNAALDVNSRRYLAGLGDAYGEVGEVQEAEAGGNHQHTVVFTAMTDCFVELSVERYV